VSWAHRPTTHVAPMEHQREFSGSPHMYRFWSLALLFLAGCASTAPLANLTVGPDLPYQLVNHGGSLEGHTPRGFAGSGTGLFAGDNLNPNFPADDGVQIWLTFPLPIALAEPAEAILRSDALDPHGTPFADLGTLFAEPVTYDRFTPEIFDLPPDGEPVECTRTGESSVECDVSESVTSAIRDGATRVQFRLKFEAVSDGDGEPDLARFFRSDPNANEPGIFTIDLR
jgi:hypothetical protein